MKNNNYYNKKQPRKIGFWDCVLGIACASAAVKITKTAYKAYVKSLDKKIDFTEASNEDAPCDYLLYKADKLADVLKCRRKIAELMDLYGATTEKEILEVMGVAVIENDLVHRVFYDKTKFSIKYKDKKYCLYAQKPEEVADDEFGDAEESEGGVPKSDVE